ncbi:LysR family transcriptional regulator [Notoacmeibacter sp. MSK16QG-6]|uniref:LysR family transcriptional regulator n=1 Tax=Notoacmeibacter sp. MSK16QG-6 TaxID=2957982 RepID=UPI0020A00625|nr:LysR family transcriptional regulator [Notoacmeibacter sp. MSK16QG-6]MCP1199552.1 LysR family transcriptional regulator [Notoacmeibacter sp. MSK16QG-6]
MDTRFLKTFLVVAKRGSLAAAAQELNLTATAVAQRLAALEAEFGTALVSRSGRTVRPTEAGFAILDKSEAFLRSLRSLKAASRGDAIRGELRAGAISTAQTGLLPDVLQVLATRHPNLAISLEPGTSGELYAQILSGQLDLAVIVRPGFDLPKSLVFDAWRTEPLILLVPAAETSDDFREILGRLPLIRYDRMQWGGNLATQFLDDAGIQPQDRFELDALDAIAIMVDRKLGAAIIPDWSGPWPQGLNVRKISLPDRELSRQIGFLYPKNTPQYHPIQAVIGLARELDQRAKGLPNAD